MRQYVLCTYDMKSEAAASDYLPRWRKHVDSLAEFGVRTHGFFSAPTEPKKVVALISLPEDADAESVLSEFAESDGFKEDMAGFDLDQMASTPKLLLRPGPGSPLS